MLEAKDTVMNFMRIEEIDAKNATSNFTDALVDVAREQAEISFKAGEKKVVEWIRQHTCKTSPNMYGISLPFFVIGSKDWQEFLKSEGIE